MACFKEFLIMGKENDEVLSLIKQMNCLHKSFFEVTSIHFDNVNTFFYVICAMRHKLFV